MGKVINGFSPKMVRTSLVAVIAGLVAAIILLMGNSVGSVLLGRTSSLAANPVIGEVDGASHLYYVEAGDEGPWWHNPAECHLPSRPYLGITYLPITKVVAQFYDLGGEVGVLVTAIESHSPADRAGLRPYDVIEEFDGVPITANNTLVALQMQRRAGENVSLTLLRQKERRIVTVTLASIGAN